MTMKIREGYLEEWILEFLLDIQYMNILWGYGRKGVSGK